MTHTRIPAPELRPARPRALRRSLVLAAAVLGVLVALVGPAGQARAAAYQYWGYWQQNAGAWVFAPKGPDQTTPADGSIEGWRFAVADETSTRMPRLTPTFAQLCGSTPAQEGKKRVGLVIDFGRVVDGDGSTTPPDAIATCAVVPTAATGSQVLATAGAVRVDKGLVCGVAGYPAAGCGGAVAAMSDAQKAADTPLVMPTTTSPTTSPAAKTAASSAAASASVSTAVTTTAATAGGSGATVWILVVLALALVGLAVVTMRRRRPAGV